MIILHRLNGSEIVINSQHIETVEKTPDTVILLTTEKRYIVKESVEEVIDKVIEFNSRIVGRAVQPPETPA
ncbi:MAG: flagellar FlbD family protein [Spirochaetota bacterium]